VLWILLTIYKHNDYLISLKSLALKRATTSHNLNTDNTMETQKNTSVSNVLSLFGKFPLHKLSRAFSKLPSSVRSTGITLPRFNTLVTKLITDTENASQSYYHDGYSDAKIVLNNSPFSTSPDPDPLLFSTSSSSSSSTHSEITDVYKQIDARDEGKVKWKDVTLFLMLMDVMASSTSPSSTDPSSTHPSSNDPSSATRGKMKYHLIDCQDTNTYSNKLKKVKYFPEPIGKVSLIEERDEGVKLLIPSKYSTEQLPRSGLELSHHTNFLQHNVLCSICAEGEDCIITSSVLDGGATLTGGFISVWDIPTAEERASGSQFLASEVQRISTEFPQSLLVYSTQEDLLFSGCPMSGVILCTRIKKSLDDVEEIDMNEVHLQMLAARKEGGGLGDGAATNNIIDDEEEANFTVLRSDPKELKDLLHLNTATRERQKKGSLIQKDAVSALTKQIMDLEKMAKPPKKVKAKVVEMEQVSKGKRYSATGSQI